VAAFEQINRELVEFMEAYDIPSIESLRGKSHRA
jgi:hypothetical protein